MELKKLSTNREQISTDQEITKNHQKDFGFEVPKDFFENSKNSILAQTIQKSKRGKIIKWVSFTSAVAAVVLLFFTVFNSPSKTKQQIALNDTESTLLINSLLVNDEQIDVISDSYMLDTFYTEEVLLN